MGTRRNMLAVVIAAAGYLVVAAISIVKPQPTDHWGAAGRALEGAFIVALLGSAVAVDAVRMHLSQRVIGARSTRLAQVGFLGMAVAAVASLLADGDTLGPVFLLSLLATLVGLLLLGITGVRESRVAAWIPVVPFATMLLGIALADHGGCAIIAAGWIALATTLSGAATPAGNTPVTARGGARQLPG